jgi:tetratricopeptide (TPR) repeat protein
VLDSTQIETLADIAGSFSKLKQYDSSAYYYELKIATGKSGMADYYRLGQTYYNGKNWEKADKAFETIINTKPEFQNGRSYYWRGLTNSNIDSTSTTWQAKPHFDKFVEMVKNDSVKYAKDLVITYDYLGSYYFLSPEKDDCKARMYWNKIIALDPKNERALDLLNKTKDKCKQ